MLEFIQSADWSILHWIQENLRCGALDALLPKLTLLGEAGAIWIAVAMGLLLTKKYRKYGVCLSLALVAGLLICNVGLKNIVARPRPCWLESIDLLVKNPRDYSFPSGHTWSAVAGAWVATVRTRGRDYELVAGERRFRAAKLAGLKELPCLIAQVGEEDSALLALMENLQRRDLNYMEEAAAIAQLVQRWGLSQEEAARKLGKSQSAVANKLRLLRLPGTVVELLQQGDLSERHARALLRLADEEEQLAAAKTIIARGLNVAQTEEYIESLLRKIQVTPPHRRPTFILKDVRLFLNSLDRSLSLMRSAGVDAACGRQDTEDEILLTIRIPKARRVG